MDCDICFEKYDKLLNKPLTLIRCAHTICAQCEKKLLTKECPTCRKPIEETAVNWLVFNLIKEPDSDNSKAEIVKATRDWTNLAKTLPELIEKKKLEIINSAKSLKKTIEQEYTVTNKLSTNYKKHICKRLDTF